MNWKEYTIAAKRTQPENPDINYLLVAFFGEVGEFLNIVKKATNHGHDPDWVFGKLIDESGDVIWYGKAILDCLGWKHREPNFQQRPNIELNIDQQMLSSSISLAVLTGEVVSIIDSSRYRNWGSEKIIELIELVVLIVYLAGTKSRNFPVVASLPGLLRTILAFNDNKLLERHPNGFSEESSKNRKEYSDGATS